jgi:hypothetical protein
MRTLVVLLLGACSYRTPVANGDGPPPDQAADVGYDVVHDGGCWTYTPTNFDSCSLAPNPVILTVAVPTTIDDTTSLPHQIVGQGDGTEVVVIHLAALEVDNVLTIGGGRPIVFAVDGDATVNSLIDIRGGANDGQRCAGPITGGTGHGSQNPNGGGGGGGGAGGAAVGGDGGDGNGIKPGGKGGAGKAISGADDLSPMRAGCPGSAGGQHDGSGTPGTGGDGGGGLQISSNSSVTVNSAGQLNASGFGGGIAATETGGGGGGSGGAVFLEGPHVTLTAGAVLCADGGAGSEGGGSNSSSALGARSPCNGTTGATTPNTTFGGDGGGGGFVATSMGGPGNPGEQNSAGGGGGGGGVGWIRIHSISPPTISGVVTPTALMN